MLKDKFSKMLPILNERQKRLYLAIEAEQIGHGGVKQVAEASMISRKTIIKGKKELEETERTEGSELIEEESQRIRKPGAGRKNIKEKEPDLFHSLELLLEPVTRGHPESVLKWTCLSTRTLAAALQKEGYEVSHTKVSELLGEAGFSLQSNAKRLEGGNHPDRNEQFMYINNKTERYLGNGYPAISVDTKKKELVGNYKNAVKEYRPKGSPRPVQVHDFGQQKAAPYGIYDIANNEGFVNVGISSDTSEFAVYSIEQWWKRMGKKQYPNAKKLLITADGGGSNSYRNKLWKTELQRMANKLKMEITVCHFPPGTSKWNKIEHRLFCHISMNWKGIPLEDYETVVQLIGAVKTKSGLKVKATLDLNEYEKGKNVSAEQLENVNIRRHKFHPEWNYTIKPNK
ncbi:MAG: ISAzo13 family transposase [Candidatus Saccharimonadales bacterium]